MSGHFWYEEEKNMKKTLHFPSASRKTCHCICIYIVSYSIDRIVSMLSFIHAMFAFFHVLCRFYPFVSSSSSSSLPLKGLRFTDIVLSVITSAITTDHSSFVVGNCI